jgi:type 1 fimbriae regulatory protein FimB/type 1 fimbriae regulatory protein FimE
MGKLASMPRTAPPPKLPNLQKRTREHLLPHEVEAMIKAARGVGRHGNRDATLILLAYRHRLRVSELVAKALGAGGLWQWHDLHQSP